MLTSVVFCVMLALPMAAAQYIIDPPTTAPEDTIRDCTNWWIATESDTCESLAEAGFISLEQLYDYNPSLRDGCEIAIDISYCIEQNFGVPPPTTTQPPPSSSTTLPGNGITTPTPIQNGTNKSCNKFYKVVSGDQCGLISSEHGISLGDFYSWNPAVGEDCRSLIVGYHVCVGIIGSPPPPTTTKPGNGITTPTPTQSGMASNCNKFYRVQSGDQCGLIASENGVDLQNFYAWNPAVGDDCRTLIADYYVCVGVIGGIPPTTSTTTTSGNGIATPTPTQTGMVGSCNKFHKVVSGDSCPDLASRYSIILSNFYAWNPAVGSDCRTLIVDFFVCVGMVGGVPPPTTTTKTTTTAPGNGISTPTPTQTGMIGNCNKFHKVVSGDGCQAIATRYSVSLSNFYKWNPAVGSDCRTLIADYHVCVGVVGGSLPPTTTTRPGNGVATPTPIQTGMVTNCDTFHKVISGDQCDAVAKKASITLANFYKWNPAVGSTCGSLLLGYYVCIGLI